MAKKLIEKLSFAFTCGILTDEDFAFWIRFPAGHEGWKKAYESTAMFEKLFSAKNCDHYKPWLLVLRNKMLYIEKEQNSALNALRQNARLPNLINCVIKWLCDFNHRNLIAWLLHFLFLEDCTLCVLGNLSGGPITLPHSMSTLFLFPVSPSKNMWRHPI